MVSVMTAAAALAAFLVTGAESSGGIADAGEPKCFPDGRSKCGEVVEAPAMLQSNIRVASLDPMDCLWTHWEHGDCSADCGGGTEPMTRTISNPDYLGIACDGQSYGEQECNTHPCPVDCTWNEWEEGECSVTCGGGTRVDTRTIFSQELHKGFCDPEGDLRVVANCNNDPCEKPIDCEWNDWEDSTQCSVTCDEGTISYTRTKKVDERSGGVCKGETTLVKKCWMEKCKKDTGKKP